MSEDAPPENQPAAPYPPRTMLRATGLGVLALVAAAAIVRGLYMATTPLLDDEAYYWDWARHLSLSYFDHPGMVAWWIAAGTRLFGDTASAVRVGAWAAYLGMLAFAGALTRDLFEHRDSRRLLLLLHAIPLFALAGFIMTPDVPLAFFWSGAMYLFWRAASLPPGAGHRWAWLGAGLMAGGGLLSKYFAAFLPLEMGLWLLADRRARGWLARPEPYLAAAVMAVMSAPVWIWNARHDWASFAYQFGGRWEASPNYARLTAAFVIGQIVAYSPLLFPFLVASIAWGWREARRGSRACGFLLWMALPEVAAFSIALCVTPRARVHWTAPGYFAVTLLTAESWRRGAFGRAAARALHAGCWVTLVAFALVLVQAKWALVAPPSKLDPALQVAGWHEVGERVADLRQELSSSWIIAVPRFSMAGQLAFYTPGRPEVISVGPEREQYDLWHPADTFIGGNLIYVAHDRYRRDPTYLGRFDSVEPLPSLPIVRAGRILRTFRIYLCRGFHPLYGPRP